MTNLTLLLLHSVRSGQCDHIQRSPVWVVGVKAIRTVYYLRLFDYEMPDAVGLFKKIA